MKAARAAWGAGGCGHAPAPAGPALCFSEAGGGSGDARQFHFAAAGGEEVRRLQGLQAFVVFVVLDVDAAAVAAGHAPSKVLGDRPPDRDVAQFSSAGVVVDPPRVLRAQNRSVDDGVFERFSEFFGRWFGRGRISVAVLTRNRAALAFCISTFSVASFHLPLTSLLFFARFTFSFDFLFLHLAFYFHFSLLFAVPSNLRAHCSL